MQKFWSVWLPSNPSALLTGVKNYFLAELSQLSAPGSAKRISQPLLP